MTRHDAARRAELWEELTRTADAVRAPHDGARDDSGDVRSWRRALAWSAYAVVLGAVTVAALHASASATAVHADGSADSALFSLTNQDRASNGVRSMSFSGTLSTIGEGGRYTGCGFAVSGRSVDMIQRNYFAHPILGCGQYVFSIMQAYGVHYMSAGENIGWNTYGSSGDAASQINSAFMNSSEHRSNILNGNYTSMGVGSDNSGGSSWSGGGGGSFTGVWMFSEEFAQLRSAPPPPPPPPPPPRPRPRPTGGTAPSRNSPAPPPPAQGPATSTAPAPAAPAPTATPLPTLPPLPTGPVLPTLTLPPLTPEPGGLLFNSVESVLETYLID